MFKVSVEGDFDAAHALRGYQGKCERLHGHRFRVVAVLEAQALNEIGITYDFVELKKHLNGVLSRLDHQNLNELHPFDEMNPSSENIAVFIYNEMNREMPGHELSSIEVWESPESHVLYRP